VRTPLAPIQYSAAGRRVISVQRRKGGPRRRTYSETARTASAVLAVLRIRLRGRGSAVENLREFDRVLPDVSHEPTPVPVSS